MAKLLRAITTDGAVLATALDSTDMAARAEQIHQSSATVTAAMGRLLTAASMMGAALKNDGDTITLRISGGGRRRGDRRFGCLWQCAGHGGEFARRPSA